MQAEPVSRFPPPVPDSERLEPVRARRGAVATCEVQIGTGKLPKENNNEYGSVYGEN